MNVTDIFLFRLNFELLVFFVTLLILVVFVVAIFKLLFKWNNHSNLSYFAVPKLFTPAELSFYHVLKQAVSGMYEVFGKVRIADVIRPDQNLNSKFRQIAFNRISSKHFDYVICDSKSLSIVAVIELDDSSHRKNKTMMRDRFVDEVCESAKIKLIRFKAKRAYQIEQIRDSINGTLNT